MPFWILFEWLLSAAVLVFVLTQVLVPIITGKPLLPWFRMKQEDAVLELVQGEIEKEKKRIEADKLQARLEELRKQYESQTPKEEKKDDTSGNA